MDRRTFIASAITGVMVAGTAVNALAAELYTPTKVDGSLFEGINRAKNPAAKTPLEKGHAPVITAPASVKAGEPFTVQVAVGESLHPMGQTHWIEFIELSIGNEPAGRIDLQPRGFLRPKSTFTVVIPKDAAPEGKLTLVARQHCNLHGLWEGTYTVSVS